MIKCSIGVCVFNEEKNIGLLLRSIRNQKLHNVQITEIIVIASGSTDNTCEIVKKSRKADRRIRLIRQEKREGKASAVNLFIKEAKEEILALAGGDLFLTSQSLEKLINKFNDEDVGMTGAHPVPVNDINGGFVEFAGHLLWDLHHRISMQQPKMGEVVAFRKIFKRIPTVGADEASIEPLIRGQGYKIIYVPSAKIYNKTPTTLKEFIEQRRRNYWLHLIILHNQSYLVSTLKVQSILPALIGYISDNPKPQFIFYIPFVIALEGVSRFLGWWDYAITKRKHTIWKIAKTTKNYKNG